MRDTKIRRDVIHVSSAAIKSTMNAIDANLTTPLESLQRNVKPQTDLPEDSFGTIGGWLLGGIYREMQEDTEDLVGDAVYLMGAWTRTLDYARRNWRTAEELSSMNVRI
ncbi:hypothetical protein [Nonomuraea jabiensis]|uniref:hypothetical protein n=1 Tax=Nonomuraea jabiensis TaxID=882448 RepID=UPI003D723BE5